jgi:D-serine deaminase-like pyridoxal phosphate-dependent protein
MVVRERALQSNIDLMAQYCRERGVLLAPHAKTTMSPEIVRRQLEAGAWGVTVASVSQAVALESLNPPRVLIANEVLDEAGIAWLNAKLAEANGEVWCYVDSVAGAQRLAAGITAAPLRVLLEVGIPGGRAGVRTLDEALHLARFVAQTGCLELMGVAGFEGILGGSSRDADGVGQVCEYLKRVHQTAAALVSDGVVAKREEIVLSAGGSVYFDLVVDAFSEPVRGVRPKVILRSGCYVTHDHGAYAALSPFRGLSRAFVPAIEVVSTVLSRPELQLAICDIGRRDVPFDAGLPIPLQVRSHTGAHRAASGFQLKKLNDQHGFLHGEGLPEVGERVIFGISHPCTAFDKWRAIPIVDDEMRVLELARTLF